MTGRRSGTERHRGREAALQLLYQREVGWAGSGGSGAASEAFWGGRRVPDSRRRFTTALVEGTTAHLDAIDTLLASSSHLWRLARMAVIDRLIMRMAIYELVYTETPKAVIIDEAIELARTFGDEPSPRFVNGVLDAVRRGLDREERETGPPAT